MSALTGEPPNKVLWMPNEMPWVRLGPRELSYEEMNENARKQAAKWLEKIVEYRKQQEKIMVRTKFKFTGIQTGYSEQSRELTFTAQYDETIPEDKRFAKATPNGTFKMTCDNPAANAQFELGKQYYFDISPVD